MKKLWIITKNELYRYFVSPLAYVYLISFLLLNASFALYFGDFFKRGQADLLSMFTFIPWIYLLFIPGIAMRSWAEEFRNKTVVQIVTMPVSVSTLVWGKFFAAWLFCTIALLLTFPFWITVNVLGEPDNGVILTGYAAAFILAGSMLSISQTMSALTKNQVIALVLAVIANLAFFWSGIEFILSFFRLFLPDYITDVIASFSFISHFNTLSRGLLELRDVIFFLSIILFFNFTTVLTVNFKTSGTSGWFKSTGKSYFIYVWIALLLGFFGINILANNLTRNIQFDATEEKLFTLSDNTLKVLRNLPEPVLGKLYFSPVLEQRNPELRATFDTVRLLLQKYRDNSDGKFDFKVYYPEYLSEEEDVALASGLQPIPLVDINQNALFGLSLQDTLKNSRTIPFFIQNGNNSPEQEITAKIYQLHHQKKTLGVIAGLPIFGSTVGDGTVLEQSWEFVNGWNEYYNIINVISPKDFEHHFDALVIFYPQNYPKELIEAVKEYSRKNGRILLLMDPANEASRLYSFENKGIKSSYLGELADFWGIRFYENYVVADLQNSITVDATSNYKTNPTFAQDIIQFRLTENEMNPKHLITRNLHRILLSSASVIVPQPEAYKSGKIVFYPLLTASPVSAIMNVSVVNEGLSPHEILNNFQPDTNQKILAAEIIGRDPDNSFDLIAVGDTDFLYDTFWGTKKAFLENEYVVKNSDNADFVLNALDYLTDNTDLIKLRGKQAKPRLFNGIEKMRKINSYNFEKQKDIIFQELDRTKRGLNEIWNKKDFEERENFTSDELAAIAKVRTRLNDLRRELNAFQELAFQDVNRINTAITLFNLLFVPALLIIFLAGIKMFTLLRSHSLHFNLAFRFDRRLAILSSLCLLLLLSGLFSVFYTNRSSIDTYEGKKVFPEIEKNINSIERIVLQSHDKKLTFERSGSLWVLKEKPDYPVYQERIRRLLTTLSQATFFEKKTNKAEHLGVFGLTPVNDNASRAVQIELYGNDRLIQSFELGDIDIDAGRGARAAFIKFDNQFQVWEIIADFVDMDIDWRKWTYSNLWDLRFGRLYSPDNSEDSENRLLLLMKYLLNTKIVGISAEKMPEPQKKLNLFIEEGNYATMSFYRKNEKSYVEFEFDKNNGNAHLKLFAGYFDGKTVEIDNSSMEKILEQLK